MKRWTRRLSAVAVGLVAALAWAGIASAHVEVEADPDTAGATDAVVTFTAEAEADSGITSVRIILPPTIPVQDVVYNKGPAGWSLTRNADGYTVGGKALPAHQNAVHSIIVTHLPDMDEVVFKAIVNYASNTPDRWIEEKSAANPNPDMPAPVLRLKPGPKPSVDATTADVVTSSPSPAVTAAPVGSTPADTSWIWWVAAAVVVVGGVVVVVVSRRRGRPS